VTSRWPATGSTPGRVWKIMVAELIIIFDFVDIFEKWMVKVLAIM
jgi:hypothetical protein